MADGTELGLATAKLMEKVERVYGEDAQIVDGVVLAEVCWTEDGEEKTSIEWWCTSPRSIVREGLVATAHKANPYANEPGDA